MPRLSKISPDQAEPPAREAVEAFIKERGKVPNMFRTVAHQPEIMATMTEHFRTVMVTGNVDRKLKEMVAVRVSHLNHCEYWLDSHTALARRFGATEDDLIALEKGNSAFFDPRERSALNFADTLTLDSGNVPDELFSSVQQHFTEGEIVEIAAVAGLFNYFNCFNDALQMEPTR